MTWGPSAVSGRVAAQPVLALVVVVYVVLDPPTMGFTRGWDPIKRLVKK